MKLLLLKTLLQRRARDEGFTLPMVIALGLVMLLLGAVSITIANEENITAITQNSRSDALAIAEVGVARYRELLDRNRFLAVNDSSVWGTQTQICDQNISSLLPTGTPPTPSPQSITDVQDLDNDGNTTENIGSYSLVSYDYTNNAATPIANGTFNLTNDTANSDARGILKVKGRASDGSEAQIQVDIPIRINLDDMTNLAPALWIGNSGITSLGNLTIGNDSDSEIDIDDDTIISNDNGNVVIRDQAVTTGTTRDGCRNFSSLASTTPRRPVISDSRDLPLITQITTDLTNARAALTGEPNTINPLPTISPGQMIFGTTSHDPFNPNANNTNCSNIKLCRYYYEFGSTTSNLTSPLTDTDLLTDGIARTTLLLTQPLTIKATNTAVTGQNVKIGSTSPVANDSNSFEIYVNGNHDITIDVASGRTVTINGFIHAPDSTLKINGAGNVTINGSVWVNDFINSSTGMVNISPDTISREPTPDNSDTSGKGYEFYSTTNSRTPRPITGSPTNWKTEEVN